MKSDDSSCSQTDPPGLDRLLKQRVAMQGRWEEYYAEHGDEAAESEAAVEYEYVEVEEEVEVEVSEEE